MILSFSWPKDDTKAPKGSNKDMETRLEFTIIRQEIADTRLEIADTRLEFVDTRLEFVDTRLEIADTRLEIADTRLEFADTRLEFTIFRQDIAIIRSYFWPCCGFGEGFLKNNSGCGSALLAIWARAMRS